MSVTMSHRRHLVVPWLSIIIVLAIAAAAVLAVVLIVESSQTTPAAGGAQALGVASTAVTTPDVPKNRSPVFRAVMAGRTAATVLGEAPAESRKYCRAPWGAGKEAQSNR